MELVADESCAGPVIRALRAGGHDLLAIADSAPGASDEAVIARAFNEGRVLITEDRDFGELVYARGHSAAGVVLVKFPSRVRSAKPTAVVEALSKLGARLREGFTSSSRGVCEWDADRRARETAASAKPRTLIAQSSPLTAEAESGGSRCMNTRVPIKTVCDPPVHPYFPISTNSHSIYRLPDRNASFAQPASEVSRAASDSVRLPGVRRHILVEYLN